MPNRCYFIHEPGVGRILIPVCYGSLHRNDLSGCTCPRDPHKQLSELACELSQLADDMSNERLTITEKKSVVAAIRVVEATRDLIKAHRNTRKLKRGCRPKGAADRSVTP